MLSVKSPLPGTFYQTPGPGEKPFKKKGDKDYLLKLNSPTEYIRLAGMRKVRTEGGALTGWEIISAKNPKKAVGILDAAERVYNDKLAEARKNKESYTQLRAEE